MEKTILINILVILSTLVGKSDYLEYEIPLDSDKYGPIETRDQSVTYIRYLEKGADPSDRTKIIGIEKFKNKVLVERKLYSEGELHGVQKEWFENNGLKSEIPYKAGILHGLCRHWSDDGKLTGSYKMENGKGNVLVFQENGFIAKSERYFDNKKEGWAVENHENGKVWVVNKLSKGAFIFGDSAVFYRSGDLRLLALNSPKSKGKDGVLVYFTPEGEYLNVVYYLNGEVMDEEVYKDRGKIDPDLPRLPKSPRDCLKLLKEDIKKLSKKFNSLERVEIPLKFDDDGNIITLSGKKLQLPSF